MKDAPDQADRHWKSALAIVEVEDAEPQNVEGAPSAEIPSESVAMRLLRLRVASIPNVPP